MVRASRVHPPNLLKALTTQASLLKFGGRFSNLRIRVNDSVRVP